MPILQIIVPILAYAVTGLVLLIGAAFFGAFGLAAWLDWRASRTFEEELKKMQRLEKRL